MAHDGQEYLERVGARIRWPRARTYLLKELSAHLEDQRAALEAEGVPPEEAERRAVADMGDPEPVGDELDALHRPAWALAPAVFALAVSLAGAALIPALTGGSPLCYWAGLLGGLAVMALLRLVDLGMLARRRAVVVLLTVGASVLATVAAYTLPRLPFGSAPLWPLYLCLFFPLLFALILLPLRGTHWASLWFFLLLICVLAIPALLLPSFSTALVLGGSMLFITTAAVVLGWFRGNRWAWLALLWGPVLLFSIWCFLQFLSFSYRLRFFLHPELDPAGYGWQILLIRNILWKGSQEAAEEYLTFPLSRDPAYSLLTLSAQLGRPVMAAALIGILLFAGLCLWRVRKLHSTSGKLLALSLFFPLFLQAGAYWLQNAGLFPFGCALSLPFFSYGPVCMVADFALLGLLLSVFRMDPLQRDGPSCPLPQLLLRLPEPLLCPEDNGEEDSLS